MFVVLQLCLPHTCIYHVAYRISDGVSQMIYDIQDLPRNRLPDLRNVARVLGTILHFTHLVVRYVKLRRLKDEDIGWEDMLGEIDMPGAPSAGTWVDWVRQMTILMLAKKFIFKYLDHARVNAPSHHLHLECRISVYAYQVLPPLP